VTDGRLPNQYLAVIGEDRLDLADGLVPYTDPACLKG
jgi:hypothetical protein